MGALPFLHLPRPLVAPFGTCSPGVHGIVTYLYDDIKPQKTRVGAALDQGAHPYTSPSIPLLASDPFLLPVKMMEMPTGSIFSPTGLLWLARSFLTGDTKDPFNMAK